MVGADRYDEGFGGHPTAARPMGESGPRSIGPEPAPDADSYWANIDYPEPRPQFVRPPVSAHGHRDRARRRKASVAIVAAALVLAGGSYAVGRVNGRAPVSGLHRRVAGLEHTVAAQRATLTARAATIARDEGELRALRDRVSATQATATTCQRAIDAADRAFGTESAALNALSVTDFTTADALTAQFGTEIDTFEAAARDCRATLTSV